MRVEAEYARGGTLAYFAAYDVHRAQVFGRCEATTGMAPFARLVEHVMTTEPYASARRVFWVVDNGASHRNWAAAARMNDAYPNAHMVHLPVHASWLNQVEIYFSDPKSAHPRRFCRPGRGRHETHELPRPLQRHRHTIRLDVHPCRPQPATGPHRQPLTRHAPSSRNRPPTN